MELGGTLLFPIDKISRKKGQDLVRMLFPVLLYPYVLEAV